jgi:hypothetical protein
LCSVSKVVNQNLRIHFFNFLELDRLLGLFVKMICPLSTKWIELIFLCIGRCLKLLCDDLRWLFIFFLGMPFSISSLSFPFVILILLRRLKDLTPETCCEIFSLYLRGMLWCLKIKIERLLSHLYWWSYIVFFNWKDFRISMCDLVLNFE